MRNSSESKFASFSNFDAVTASLVAPTPPNPNKLTADPTAEPTVDVKYPAVPPDF